MEHVGGRGGMLAQIRSKFPDAAVFETPLETKNLSLSELFGVLPSTLFGVFGLLGGGCSEERRRMPCRS